MKPGQFLSELRRRHVLRVVGAYAVAAWVLVEVHTTVQPILLETYEWTNKVVVVLALLGFPITVVLAWIFDITTEGVRRTAPLEQVPTQPGVDAAPAVRAAAGAGTRRPRYLSGRATGFFGLGVLVALVAFAAYAGFDRGTVGVPAATEAIESIAVLPFADMSAAQDQEFFSDGVTEELLNRLAQVPELRVAARTSSFAFKGRNEDVGEIGRKLGVQAVLEGSVRRDGEQLRISAKLVDVRTGKYVWSENFDGTARDVFGLQDDVARGVVDALRHRFAAPPEAGRRGTHSMRAYDLYLLGLKRWNLRSDRNLRQALQHFQDAVAEDPEFALAHAGIAQTYAVLPIYGAYPVDSAVLNGFAAAALAISIDPSLADAYAAMGQIVQNFEWDLAGAESYYRRALVYQPGNTTAHQWYAETLMLMGRLREAAPHVERVTAADPLAATALYVHAFLKLLQGEADESLATWRELMRLHPEFELGFAHHAYAAVAAGRTDEAARSVERLATLQPLHAALYGAVARALRDPSAAPAARSMLTRAAGMPLSDRAALHMALGDTAAALAALQQAHHQHTDANLPYVLVHPLMKPLHGNAAFTRITAELELGVGGTPHAARRAGASTGG
jgi:TolB-like protein/tetratricopeptide (TPR) repeat protein